MLIMFSSSYRRLFREKIKRICRIRIERKSYKKVLEITSMMRGGKKSLVFFLVFLNSSLSRLA